MDAQFQQLIRDQLADISQSLAHLLPEYLIAGAILLLLILDIWAGKWKDHGMFALSLLSLLAAIYFSDFSFPTDLFEKNLRIDSLSTFGKYLFAGIAIVCLSFQKFSHQEEKSLSEDTPNYSIWMGLILGLYFLSMSLNFLYIYLSLEIISICSYLLTAWNKQERISAEAGLKYLIFGATASAIMLYGISLIYGFGGSLQPTDPAFLTALESIPLEAQLLAFSLFLAGFLFKIAAFPFHFWAPDVYEAIPFPLAAFFSVAPKAGGFIVLVRLLDCLANSSIYDPLLILLGLLAVLSMTVGNLLALRQKDIKRLLAYSGIAHTGFLLMAIICLKGLGLASLLFYLTIYSLLNLSAFMLGAYFTQSSQSVSFLEWQGLGKHMTFAAILLSISFAGLIGLPPTAGFIAKWYVFVSLFEQSQGGLSNFWVILIIAGIVNSLISIYYYLLPLIQLFFKKSTAPIAAQKARFELAISSLLLFPVMVLGVYGFDGLFKLFQSFMESS